MAHPSTYYHDGCTCRSCTSMRTFCKTLSVSPKDYQDAMSPSILIETFLVRWMGVELDPPQMVSFEAEFRQFVARQRELAVIAHRALAFGFADHTPLENAESEVTEFDKALRNLSSFTQASRESAKHGDTPVAGIRLASDLIQERDMLKQLAETRAQRIHALEVELAHRDVDLARLRAVRRAVERDQS